MKFAIVAAFLPTAFSAHCECSSLLRVRTQAPTTDVRSPQMTHKNYDVVARSIVNFNPVMPISHHVPASASKIYSDGPEFTSSGALTWPTEFAETIPINLPECLEDGDHLLRIERIGLH
ncbi:hypothetical protein DL770_007062 [Monosporascus sp. CRB-9-2]|nr:hypothetical protein DL770_007062 [Monosporascus sp. CRB-9-2]